jgi:hypothetical protein
MVVQKAELDQDDKPKWIGLMITLFLAGGLIFGAQDIIEWMSGESLDDGTADVPQFMLDLGLRGLGLLRWAGAFVIVVGAIIGAIKL